MRERSRFKEDREAVAQQTERQVETASATLKEINAAIIVARDKKKNIETFLDEACRGKIEELNSAIKKLDDKKKEYESEIEDAKKQVHEFDNHRTDFNAYVVKETKRIQDALASAEHQKTVALELKARNEKERDEIKTFRLSVEVLSKEADKKIVEIIQKEKDNHIWLSDIIVREKKQANLKEVLDIQQAEINLKIDENKKLLGLTEKKGKDNLVAANALLKEKERLDKKEVEIRTIAEQTKNDKDEALLAIKQNAIEMQRLRAYEKDLNNKDARITERENIINAKLGG